MTRHSSGAQFEVELFETRRPQFFFQTFSPTLLSTTVLFSDLLSLVVCWTAVCMARPSRLVLATTAVQACLNSAYCASVCPVPLRGTSPGCQRSAPGRACCVATYGISVGCGGEGAVGGLDEAVGDDQKGLAGLPQLGVDVHRADLIAHFGGDAAQRPDRLHNLLHDCEVRTGAGEGGLEEARVRRGTGEEGRG